MYTKYTKRGKKRSGQKVDWVAAPDVKKRLTHLISQAEIEWLRADKIHCVRSTKSSARAYARIWGLNRLWQQILDEEPTYIVEVLAQNYDKLSVKEQDNVLLHELAHIPKNFSGSLVPHFRKGKNKFHDKVEGLIARYLRAK